MLKIKDSVDLKELEKFGFKNHKNEKDLFATKEDVKSKLGSLQE